MQIREALHWRKPKVHRKEQRERPTYTWKLPTRVATQAHWCKWGKMSWVVYGRSQLTGQVWIATWLFLADMLSWLLEQVHCWSRAVVLTGNQNAPAPNSHPLLTPPFPPRPLASHWVPDSLLHLDPLSHLPLLGINFPSSSQVQAYL